MDTNKVTEFALLFLLLWTIFTVTYGNSVHSCGPIVYTRDQLLAFRNTPMLLEGKKDIPRELRRRRRGNRAGVMQPASTRTVTTWSDETSEALKDCFETTVWEELCSPHGEDIDSLTDCITDYINFCVENTVPTRIVRCFPNNKPWINHDIKTLLKEKKKVFRSGNKEELKTVQRELRKKIREGKACYKRRMEDQLQQNNVRGVWKGLKTITGHKESSFQAEGDQKWVNDLNLFFNRFDQLPSPAPIQSPLLKSPLSASTAGSSSPTSLCTAISSQTIHKTPNSPPCRFPPANTPSYTHCPLQKPSLKLGKVPQIWKTSCVVPVPKTSRPKDFGDYRPVALTSHLMKTLERLVLTHLRPLWTQ
ncbi:unnamed protein product [Leuciscus chuanchicus]